MSEINTITTEAAAIAALAREAESGKAILLTVDHPSSGKLLHKDHRLISTEVYQATPIRMRTHVKVDTPPDLYAYVKRLGPKGSAQNFTAVFAHRNSLTITAILDYPSAASETGWASHRCSCTLERSQQVLEWLGKAGAWMDQETMAEFLDLNLNDIQSPTPSDVLSFVEKLTCTRKETFSSAVNQTTGEVQFSWAKENQQHESIKMVTEFKLAIPIWHRSTPILIGAKLHHRIREEGGKAKLYFRFKLEHLDRIEDKLWNELLHDATGTWATLKDHAACYEGQAPEPQQPISAPILEASRG